MKTEEAGCSMCTSWTSVRTASSATAPATIRTFDPSYPYWDMSAYCVLDNDYDISQFGYPDPTLPLKVTAAHELFHAVQFAYDIGEDGWLMEGTATWMEERVYDAINDNRRYLVSSPLARPLIPLDHNTGFRVYGTWIFWQFLTEYLGGAVPDPTIVRAVWKRADGSPVGQDMYSTQALASAVGARTVGGTRWRFRWAFADFAVWNARPGKYYDEGGAYPTAAGGQDGDPHQSCPLENVDGQARPPDEPLRGRAEGLRAEGDRQAPDRRGRSGLRDGPGGERHRDTEVRCLHVQGG